MPAGLTTGTTVCVVPIGIRAGIGTADPGGGGWTICGVDTGGTAAHVALAFPIVWVHRPELKKLFHLSLIIRHMPVKNKNMASIKNIKAKFAMVDPDDSPKLIVIAITLGP